MRSLTILAMVVLLMSAILLVPVQAEGPYPVSRSPYETGNDSKGEQRDTRVGITFDWKATYSPILDEIGNVDMDPVISILTPGLGVIIQDGANEWRVGVRPEFVLTPHNQSDDAGNEVGIDQFVIEILAEYKMDKTVFGIAYKKYHLEGDIPDHGCEGDIADLSTLSIYGKFGVLVLGYNIVDVEPEGFGEGLRIEGDSTYLVGIAVEF